MENNEYNQKMMAGMKLHSGYSNCNQIHRDDYRTYSEFFQEWLSPVEFVEKLMYTPFKSEMMRKGN